MRGESALNLLNGHCSTPLDCLELYPKDYKSQRIRNILVKAAGGVIRSRSQYHPTLPSYNLVPLPAQPPKRRKTRRNCFTSICREFKYFLAYDSNWLDEMKETVLLVATIIASMSFQAATNPPGGVWDENKTSSDSGKLCSNNSTSVCKAGTSVLAYGDRPDLLNLFVALSRVRGVPGDHTSDRRRVSDQEEQAGDVDADAICVYSSHVYDASVCGCWLFRFNRFWLMRVVIPGHTMLIVVALCWGLLLIVVLNLLHTFRFAVWVFGKMSRLVVWAYGKLSKVLGCCCSSNRGGELV